MALSTVDPLFSNPGSRLHLERALQLARRQPLAERENYGALVPPGVVRWGKIDANLHPGSENYNAATITALAGLCKWIMPPSGSWNACCAKVFSYASQSKTGMGTFGLQP
jgi:hypothetical protein